MKSPILSRIHGRIPVCALALLAFPLTGSALPAQTAGADSAAFVTRLGTDTLVLERVVSTPQRVEAEVLLRTPTTSRTRYVLELSPVGELESLTSTGVDVRTGGETPNPRRQTVTRDGDSLNVLVVARGDTTRRTVAASGAVLPFIDMVHWPFDIALVRARSMSAGTVAQPLLTGARTSDFTIGRVGADSMTITHPSRGTMRVRVDSAGHLVGLDAGATTRKLIVERRSWLALDSTAAQWAAADAAGRGAGALSGRGGDTLSVHGATIALDYGTPVKRGREIWGALVPFGEVWRTGANRATHFSTDRELVFGSGTGALVVPAGDYTLFSIPEQGGGTLIINRETGQAGTAHDPSQDLGRVRLAARALPASVEVFTITTSEVPAGGELRLQWDDAEMVVPFVVRGR